MDVNRYSRNGDKWTDGTDLGVKSTVLGAQLDGVGQLKDHPPALQGCCTRVGALQDKLCNVFLIVFLTVEHISYAQLCVARALCDTESACLKYPIMQL